MLEARDLTFAYDHNAPIIERLNVQVVPTDRLAIVAPSGRGKTTLCRLLAGYEKPASGEVLLDGAPLPGEGWCPVQLIGQHPELTLDPRMRMGASLEEAGLSVGGESQDAENEGLLEALGIRKEWLSRYPHELSGGELQRFCIARALAKTPSYLICDEISTMLDAVTQARLWEFLLSHAEENAIGLIFVSHSPALTERISTHCFMLPN